MRALLVAVAVLVSCAPAALADGFTVSPDYPRRSWHPAGPDGTGGSPPPREAPLLPLAPGVPAGTYDLGAYPRPSAPPPCAAPCPAETYDVCDPCARHTLEIGGRGRWWRARAYGSMFITRGGEPGSGQTLNLCDDLDLERGNSWLAEVDVRLDRHRARFAYEDISSSGTNVLDRSRVYHGVTYPAGERVESDLSLRLFEAGYEYQLVGGDRTNVWAGLQGWVWTFDSSLKGTTSGLDESRGFTHLLPVATLSVLERFGAFALSGSVRGGLLDTDRWALDLEAGLAWRPCRAVVLTLGWRRLEFAFHETTNVADLVFSGPFLGLSASF
jgi:hypothetical protein